MDNNKLLRIALVLAIITIVYNIVEGLFSVFFGASDDTLALLGFGVDSFVEVISGIGVLHMVIRMQHSKTETYDKFERQALKITGTAFYLLTIGLIVGSLINVFKGIKPETTIAGIIISSISIITMYFLMKAKLRIGHKLNSDAIIADANCTKTCFYLSFILLGSSLLFELFGIRWFDIIGSLGIAWFAFAEGREAFEKSKAEKMGCSCGCHS
ncbi:MAG: cation transporter [Bacteroidales bacterium]|nr:cation transporter [Bacteroidales bacterium]